MSCKGCKHYLGGGCCRMNLESECAAGDFELYETEPANVRVYRYYCKARPPMIGGIPHSPAPINCKAFGERRYVPEVDCMAWGWVEYDQPLSAVKIADYELRSAPREE
jgi:hypothetical protein